MATYEVIAPGGKTLELEGDHEPTEAELTSIFKETFLPDKSITDFMAEPDAAPTETSPLTSDISAPQGNLGTAFPSNEREAIQQQIPESDKPGVIGQDLRLPRAGAEGSYLRGISDTVAGTVEWAVNNPSEAAMMFAGGGGAVAAYYGPQIALQWGKDVVAGLHGDKEALGRASTIFAAIKGPEVVRKAREEFLQRGESAVGRPSAADIDQAVLNQMTPREGQGVPAPAKAPSIEPQPSFATEPGTTIFKEVKEGGQNAAASRKMRKPIVPEEGTSERMTAVEEVRAAGATTKAQIQALYPGITREQAGEIRRAAYPAAAEVTVFPLEETAKTLPQSAQAFWDLVGQQAGERPLPREQADAIKELLRGITRPPATTQEILGEPQPSTSEGDANAISQQSSATLGREVLRNDETGQETQGVPVNESGQGIRGDKNQGAPGTQAEIPLGLNRPSRQDPSLRTLSDEEFQTHRKQINQQLEQAETTYDERELSRPEQEALGRIQDQFDAVELEKYRRDHAQLANEELFPELLKLTDNLDPARGLRVLEGTPDFQRLLILREILEGRTGKEGEMAGEWFKQHLAQSADAREVYAGRYQRLRELFQLSNAPTPESEVSATRGTGEVASEPTAETGPGLVGMGGALEGEVAPGAGEDIFGIAQRVREQMSETGRFPYTSPGEGTTAWESIQRGRQLLRDGVNADEVLASFERTQRVSSDDVAVLRAHMEELYRESRRAEEQHGTESPQWLQAQQKLNDFFTRTKAIATEAHKIFVAHQGATDIDTGDLVSLARAHMEKTGKGFTKEQAQEGEKVTGRVRKARKDLDTARNDLIKAIDAEVEKKAPGVRPAKTLDESRAQFAEGAKEGGTPGKLNPKQVRAIWDRARNEYVAKGEANLDNIAKGLSEDFGVPMDQIKEALAGSKGTKRLTDEMYVKQSRARQLEAAARKWLAEVDTPKWVRALKDIPNRMFSAVTAGHGTVGMVTHAGAQMFDPRIADIYWRNFAEQFRLAYKGMLNEDTRGAYHESRMNELIRSKNWVVAKRAGLANDPFKFYDDFQAQQAKTGVGYFIKAGNRGFDVLKLFRQDLFDREWNALAKDRQTPEAAKAIAELVNHATGVVTGNVFGAAEGTLNTMMFAPRLEASRWAWLFKDSARSLQTLGKWAAGKETTPTERMAAISDATRKGAIFGTYMSMLAVNQALLSAFGTSQEINFTDPRRGDFLAFKGFGHEVHVVGPILRLIGFLADEVRIATQQRSKLEQLEGRGKEMGGRATEYFRGKLSPFGQTAADMVTSEDFKGQPMPWSEERPRKSLRRQGLEAHTWPHYVITHVTPIPVEEMLKHVWEGQGIDEATATQWLNGLLSLGVTGFTGVRVPEDKRAGE